jgi:cytochrome c553
MKATFTLCVLALGGLLAARAAAEDKSPTPAAPAATPATIDWQHMDKAQKKKYMKEKVLPEMKVAFIHFDGKKYAKVSCGTCHGEGAVKGTFKMPNPELPKLPSTPAGFKELFDKKPKVSQFMATEVKPKMAALLGLQQMTPDNPKGFGCTHCHEVAKN